MGLMEGGVGSRNRILIWEGRRVSLKRGRGRDGRESGEKGRGNDGRVR